MTRSVIHDLNGNKIGTELSTTRQDGLYTGIWAKATVRETSKTLRQREERQTHAHGAASDLAGR
jgi:hypothetical protein